MPSLKNNVYNEMSSVSKDVVSDTSCYLAPGLLFDKPV